MTYIPTTNPISQTRGLVLRVGFCFGFTGLIWLAGDRFDSFELRPDRPIPVLVSVGFGGTHVLDADLGLGILRGAPADPLVALSNAPDFWQMFCFGFAGLFIVTQMHGLGLSVRARWGFLLTYVVSVSVVYSQIGIGQIHQVTLIPLTEYRVAFVLAAIVWLVMSVWLVMRLCGYPRASSSASGQGTPQVDP